MWQAQLPALAVAVPLMAAPLAALLGRGAAWWLAAVTSLVAFTIAVLVAGPAATGAVVSYNMGGWPPPFGIELRVGAFSALLLLITSGASMLALLAGRHSLDLAIVPERRPFFYAAWLLALGGLTGIVVSGDAFNIFVFMEVSSLATYILIASSPDARALPAVFKYLILGTIGATFYLIGIGLIYMMTGTLNLADMAARVPGVADLKPVLAATGFITIGLALKAGLFPLHLWLPNAYARAPHVVTAFIAACSTKVALYLLLLFDFTVFEGTIAGHGARLTGLLLTLGVLAALVASTIALREPDLKRMFAWSSVAQVGYIALGAGMLSVAGLTAGIAHLFNHALAKGTLFLALAGIAVHCPGLRLCDIAGIGRHMPWTMAALVVAGLSLIGIPGTAGFISKWLLVLAALEQGGIGVALVVVILLSSLLAVAYVWRVVETAYFGSPGPEAAAAVEAPAPALALLWTAAFANIWFGLAPGLPLDLAHAAAMALAGATR